MPSPGVMVGLMPLGLPLGPPTLSAVLRAVETDGASPPGDTALGGACLVTPLVGAFWWFGAELTWPPATAGAAIRASAAESREMRFMMVPLELKPGGPMPRAASRPARMLRSMP